MTRMLSPSFYVVPHNTQDPPAPPAQKTATIVLISTQHLLYDDRYLSNEDTISSYSRSPMLG
jgi:hypothetical protein